LTEEQKHKSKIWVAESTIVKSEDEAMIHYDKCIKHGHEGTVVKNMNAVWQPKRTKDCGKCKAEEDCDLVVVGWVLGTGKYSNMLGNLVCETSDGKLRVNVGSGFSDEERAQPPEYFLDKIVTVRYNQLIKSKDEAKAWTLFLPRFVCLRDFADKSIPNNFEELK
jgi:DNA ligase-1